MKSMGKIMKRSEPLPGKGRPTASYSTRVQVTLTLPPELVDRIDAVATKEERSRSKVVEMVMREHLDARKAA